MTIDFSSKEAKRKGGGDWKNKQNKNFSIKNLSFRKECERKPSLLKEIYDNVAPANLLLKTH